MLASECAPRDVEGHVSTTGFCSPSKARQPKPREVILNSETIGSVIVVEFRDEVYASIETLFQQHGLVMDRAESATELADKLVRHKAELVLINGTQPDESAWLTSAKLRIIDAYRSVWIYTPKGPSAIDEWLSMAGADDIIVYGGILHSLIDALQHRLASRATGSGRTTRKVVSRISA
ncbi:hypothetical protein [Botrimarina mediterranea]|uniref:Response regulatory domain-containing protein n=1 Tax=Botrimarina mediterranea TaxID=2528022 RepID=A0A518K7I7_9BACT|nr:hypothetical protein [Botrimarina mediterranea]QDV73755.1 hypothetical protein Spa11_19540 [Botrimarina mediterranea]